MLVHSCEHRDNIDSSTTLKIAYFFILFIFIYD